MRWRSSLLLAAVVSQFWIVGTAQSQSVEAFYKKRYAMGTVFEVVVYDKSSEHAAIAMEKALDEAARLDQVMSNYKADSELSRLNREAHYHAVSVSQDLYAVIAQSLEYSKLSDGKYDISVGPLVDLWKTALEGGATPTVAQERRARECVGYKKLRLIPPDKIEFSSSCMKLDLGSIGKGYAVDKMADILRANGIDSAYINAGGSTMLGLGSPPGHAGWLVHLLDPANQYDPQIELSGNSASTSEQTVRTGLEPDAPGHIVEPGSGAPLKSRYAVSVVAKTGTASDALSTTLLLVGPEKGAEIVRGIPGAAAVWISPNGQEVSASNGVQILLSKTEVPKSASNTIRTENGTN